MRTITLLYTFDLVNLHIICEYCDKCDVPYKVSDDYVRLEQSVPTNLQALLTFDAPFFVHVAEHTRL